jgi:O-antigen/teichoic acid export membrane protein
MINFLKSKLRVLFDKLTELTGIDVKYVARGGIWSTIDLFVGNGAALLLAMAFARLLPPDVYGTYSFALSWAGIFAVFALSGIDSALVKSVAEGYEGDLQLAIKYKLKWGLISSLISLGFAAY